MAEQRQDTVRLTKNSHLSRQTGVGFVRNMLEAYQEYVKSPAALLVQLGAEAAISFQHMSALMGRENTSPT